MSLYNEYRPKEFSEVYGQDSAVKLLESILQQPFHKRPKVFLMAGPSGSGKTCLAYIYSRKMNCPPEGFDFRTLDASKDRSIDRIRAEVDLMGSSPMNKEAESRVWLIDEAHQLLTASQEALLKVCEEAPPKTTIIFATTLPEKLGSALKSRCKTITLNALSNKDMANNMLSVAKRAGIEVGIEDIKKLVLASEGNARVSMQLLENYSLNGHDVDAAIAMASGACSKLVADTYTLCRAIINRNSDWSMVKDFMGVYKGQHEAVRQAILGYLKSCILNSKTAKDRQRLTMLIECFITPFYGNEEAGLVYQLATAWDIK